MSDPMQEGEEFAFQHSSPLSLRQPSNLSSPPAPPLEDPTRTSFDSNASNNPFDHALKPGDLSELSDDRRISGQSSISSFPASVLHHDVSDQRTAPVSPIHRRHDSTGSYNKTPSPRRHRGFASAFRNPSSIREMQLNDDTGDDTESVMSHRSRMSVRSHHSSYSTNTSPSKRSSRSAQKKGSGLKKEFPLVLLHCTLLPPANNCLGPACDKDLFTAILPEPYRQRWTQLQDRLGSAELRSRGILLPHPQEEYDLLEERLLEALELEQPRIQGSHYLDHGGDSGFESGSQTDSEVDPEDKCPDCGKHLRSRIDKKWEIKVFAANGLMRGAAWSAAWRDMEKVDVEIGMSMPEDVRREVDARLEALRAAEAEATMQSMPEEETYAERRRSYEREAPPPEPEIHSVQPDPQPEGPATHLFLQDRRNIAIIVLSFIVLVYAVLNARNLGKSQAKDPARPPALATAIDTTVITSTEIWTTTLVAHDTPSSSSAAPSVAEETPGELPESTSVAAAETGGEATAVAAPPTEEEEATESNAMDPDTEADVDIDETGSDEQN